MESRSQATAAARGKRKRQHRRRRLLKRLPRTVSISHPERSLGQPRRRRVCGSPGWLIEAARSEQGGRGGPDSAVRNRNASLLPDPGLPIPDRRLLPMPGRMVAELARLHMQGIEDILVGNMLDQPILGHLQGPIREILTGTEGP